MKKVDHQNESCFWLVTSLLSIFCIAHPYLFVLYGAHRRVLFWLACLEMCLNRLSYFHSVFYFLFRKIVDFLIKLYFATFMW